MSQVVSGQLKAEKATNRKAWEFHLEREILVSTDHIIVFIVSVAQFQTRISMEVGKLSSS